MDHDAAMAELKARGTEQNRKVYGRHGAGDDVFGVSYADLGKLKKSIRTDQSLAESLWASGNHDARLLAAMIADPATIPIETLESWVADVFNYPLVGALSEVAAKSPHARTLMARWIGSGDEWVASTGWSVLARLATDPKADLTDEQCVAYLERIEAGIESAPNRVRHEMNGVVIAIGLRNPTLQDRAISSARRIGRVEVDHGQTGCKTPAAEPYILKAAARKKA